MDTNLYINEDIEPLFFTSTVANAQLVLDKYPFSHFPVLDTKTYKGCVSEEDIQSFDLNKTLAEYPYSFEGFFVRDDANWLDILQAFAQNDCNIMPILDADNMYRGCFELTDIMKLFNQTPFLKEPGNILIVEKGTTDFSFSEVSQIVESNNAKILGLFISNMKNDVSQITLKIGDSDINNIVQTFRRYSYTIISNHQEDSFLNNLKDRSKYLEKYLNI